MIGIFDSGLGGLTALREARRLMPNEDFIYLGDTGRVPYGSRSHDIINRYAAEALRFLEKANVDAVLTACGTVSSVALHNLQMQFDFPVIGVVEPAAIAAVKATQNGKIGVIGTSTTISSHSFEKAIHRLDMGMEILGIACPLFVPLVENGFIGKDDSVTTEVARRYLLPIQAFGADTLILGCTHFPIIADIIRKVLPGVTLINSGKEAAEGLARAYRPSLIDSTDIFGEITPSVSGEGSGTTRYYVTDNPENFNTVAAIFLGDIFRGEAIKTELDG